MTIHHRTCHLCEAMCGLRLHVEDGAVQRLEGDPDDPLSGGYLCPKAFALIDLQADPDWQERPLRRVGDDWEEMGWEEAFDYVAERLKAVQQEHGWPSLCTVEFVVEISAMNWNDVPLGERCCRGGRGRLLSDGAPWATEAACGDKGGGAAHKGSAVQT